MDNLSLIFLCLFLGFALKRLKIFPANAHESFNRFVIYLSLPALTLFQMHHVVFRAEMLLPISMAWILFLLGFIFFQLLDRFYHFAPKTKATLILTASLGNTSFVGFPLLAAYFGSQVIPYGILIDQPGTFLVAGTLGIALASFYAGTKISLKIVLQKVFSFPPFLAIFLSLFLRGVNFPLALEHVLERLGSTLAPVAIFSVGLQLHFDRITLQKNVKNLFLGLGFKLFLAPLFFLFLFGFIFHQRGELFAVEIVEAAMAPMITAGIIVSEYGLDDKLGSLMIGLGIPVSIATTYLWSLLKYWF